MYHYSFHSSKSSVLFVVSSLRFEKAYCEYRLNRTQEACTTLKSIESPDYKAKELLAQVVSY